MLPSQSFSICKFAFKRKAAFEKKYVSKYTVWLSVAFIIFCGFLKSTAMARTDGGRAKKDAME